MHHQILRRKSQLLHIVSLILIICILIIFPSKNLLVYSLKNKLKNRLKNKRVNIYEDVNDILSLFQIKNNVTNNNSAVNNNNKATTASVTIKNENNNNNINNNNKYNYQDQNVDADMRDKNALDYVIRLKVCSWSSIDYCSDNEFYKKLQDLKRTEKIFDPVERNLIEMLAPLSGEHIADVGSGYGNTVFKLSRIMSNGGLVMGIDNSKKLLNEATKTLNKNTPNPHVKILFRKAQAETLNRQIDSKFFGTFGGVIVKRLLIHSSAATRIVGQLIRLIRVGGRIVIAEPDWASFKIDHPDRPTTRKIQKLFENRLANPLVGRSLRRIFRDVVII